MRIPALLVVIGVIALAAGFPRQPSAAETAKSRIVDRTVVCSISAPGVREIDVKAQTGNREFGDPSKWRLRPSASFYDTWGGTTASPGAFAWIVAGWPPLEGEPGAPRTTVTLAYSKGCRISRSRVPLSIAGLVGGPASPFGDEYDCVVPAKILVRIKAVFRAPTDIRRWQQTALAASGWNREGTLAIGTLSGKPIALATVHESGRARLFVGPTCGPNG